MQRHFKVTPDELRIVAGERYLRDYTDGAYVAHHYLCRRCGVHPFDRVDLSPPRDPYYDAWEQIPKEIRHL